MFTESVPPAPEHAPVTVVSSVADVYAAEREDAIRISNTLTAALNGKPAEYGASRLNTQYIPEERKLRVTLYGGARFTAAMLEALALLTGETEQTE